MFSNIKPYLCTNIGEFDDEREYLRERTFPRIKQKLKQLNINFEPVQIECELDEEYVQQGYYLRLLLNNIERCNPFFICLLGQQYGPYAPNDDHLHFAASSSGVAAAEDVDDEEAGGGGVSDNDVESEPAGQYTNPRGEMSWIEKNILIASQTGYSHLINAVTYKNSFLEYQINAALYDEAAFPYYRFYYRQAEYIDDKFAHLPEPARSQAMAMYEPENDYCEFKIKDLKMKIAKKGLMVQYYSTLEQLDKFIYDDFIEMVQNHLQKHFAIKKSRQQVRNENLVYKKLTNYIPTDSVVDTFRNVDMFLKQKPAQSVRFKLDAPTLNDIENADDLDFEKIETIVNSFINDKDRDDYLEILKLRHIDIANAIQSQSAKNNVRSTLLILGARGTGKTAFMAFLYQHYVLKSPAPFNQLMKFVDASFVNLASSPSVNSQGTPLSRSRGAATQSKHAATQQNDRPESIEPFFLFYFLQSDDHLLSMLVDITCKMRSKYMLKESMSTLGDELHDTRSILEQFNAALGLGPVYIFIDGLNECTHSLKLTTWLPAKLDNPDCKFVITLSKSSESYAELSQRKSCMTRELQLFAKDTDYMSVFAQLLCNANPNKLAAGLASSSNQSNNILFGMFMSHFHELKTANHIKNPLYIQLIAQEIFSFDREIYKTHPVLLTHALNVAERKDTGHHDDLPKELKERHRKLRPDINTRKASMMSMSSTESHKASVNIINAYIEEVTTLRELIQKIIRRYLKKFNWSRNRLEPLSYQNPGWIGDVLCLIALSPNGITKDTIFRILKVRGYHGELKVDDFHWCIFRMKFGNFIQDGLGGLLTFTHDYFKEAVQTLLLNGFSVTVESKPEENVRALKKNISNKEIELHLFIILDLLRFGLNKNDFDLSVQLDNHVENEDVGLKCLDTLNELIHHLFMIHDLVNLCKVLTSFKVIQLYNMHRTKNLNAWFAFIECIKMSTNVSELRQILLRSMTVGIAKYAFDMQDSVVSVKRTPSPPKTAVGAARLRRDMQENTNERMSIQTVTTPNSSRKLNNNYNSYTSHSKSQGSASVVTASYDGMEPRRQRTFVDQLVGISSQGINDVYESLLDNLLELNEATNRKNRFSDNLTILMVSRGCLLVDLIANLDDKFFQENLSLNLCNLINNVIIENYPLNDTEKLSYTGLLEVLSKNASRANDNETAAKHLLKSIEILEDFSDGFYFSNVNKKYKTRAHLLAMLNKLCHQYTLLALLLLKLNDVQGAETLLIKADTLLNERRMKIVDQFEKQLGMDREMEKNDADINERHDTKQLIYKLDLVDFFKEQLVSSSSVAEDNDNSVFVDAKFNYYFVSALLEVQLTDFKKANTFFESALNLARKWYGQFHFNTAKIYHYYGCFYSLQEAEFFNPSRAELFFRKALHIREREKPNSLNLMVTGQQQANKNFTSRDADVTDRSMESTGSLDPVVANLTGAGGLSPPGGKKQATRGASAHVYNEEQNTIAEILFDLGCLLSTYDSHISKKESIECLRRCLDIKTLIMGLNHTDCVIIKKRLNEIVAENIDKLRPNHQQMAENVMQLQRSQSSIAESGQSRHQSVSALKRPGTSMRTCVEITPRQRLNKYISEFREKYEVNAPTPSGGAKTGGAVSSNPLDQWIRQNSIIEIIPSKLDMAERDSTPLSPKPQQNSQEQQRTDSSSSSLKEHSEFVRGDNDQNLALSRAIEQAAAIKQHLENQRASYSELPPTGNAVHSSSQVRHAKFISSSLSGRMHQQLQNQQLRFKQPSSTATVPAAVVSTEQMASVSRAGHPRTATQRSNVNRMNLSLSGHQNLDSLLVNVPNRRDNQLKAVKNVYYQTAWINHPPGSVKTRFRNFVKLTPNAYI